MLLAQSIAHRK